MVSGAFLPLPALSACLGVYNVQSMGLGGGFLLTHYSASSGRVESLDAREEAPGAATQDMFRSACKRILITGTVSAADYKSRR